MADLMNVVRIVEFVSFCWVDCQWCEFCAARKDFADANDCKIDHENQHGIFSDPDTGELYYDPTENTLGGTNA